MQKKVNDDISTIYDNQQKLDFMNVYEYLYLVLEPLSNEALQYYPESTEDGFIKIVDSNDIDCTNETVFKEIRKRLRHYGFEMNENHLIYYVG